MRASASTFWLSASSNALVSDLTRARSMVACASAVAAACDAASSCSRKHSAWPRASTSAVELSAGFTLWPSCTPRTAPSLLPVGTPAASCRRGEGGAESPRRPEGLSRGESPTRATTASYSRRDLASCLRRRFTSAVSDCTRACRWRVVTALALADIIDVADEGTALAGATAADAVWTEENDSWCACVTDSSCTVSLDAAMDSDCKSRPRTTR